MGQFYEVQFAKQLGGTDQYGNKTYSVKFTTEDGTALMRVAGDRTVEPGQKVFGNIQDKVSASGKQYRLFKREQQDGFSSANSNFTISGNASGQKDDRADGMRQGMSINNATSLVEAFIKTGVYTNTDPKELVADIESYAREIYKIDLTSQAATTTLEAGLKAVDNGTLLDDVEQFFPSNAASSMGPQ
jgi:hypothetical protein